MNETLKQLVEIKDEISNNKLFRVYEFAIEEPNEADKEIEMNIYLEEFYSHFGGFKFSFGWNENTPKTIRKEFIVANKQHRIDINSDEENPLGCINLLPPDNIFQNSFFHYGELDNNLIEFDHQFLPMNELSKRIRPFDLYSEFAGAAFYRKEDKDVVFMVDGHYDDWLNSRFSNFTTYLKFVIQTKFFVNSRKYAYYHPSGHQIELITLDELISKTGVVEF